MQSSATGNTGRSQRTLGSANRGQPTASPLVPARSEESWIEIASQPSSSSLSSAGDEIVTTGLRVQETARRRRRSRNESPIISTLSHARSIGDISSQEEYEESESESDRVMTSSNEGLVMDDKKDRSSKDEDATTSDEEENRTAVNCPIRGSRHQAFTPRPNAFSHPPTSYGVRHASEPSPGSYFPQMQTRNTQRSTARRSSISTEQTRVQHSPYNIISPSHNAAAHHDAALRASLSTLLSCAAAARGLPKLRSQQTAAQPSRPSNRVETNAFRLVPESALPGAQNQTRAMTTDALFPPTIRQRSFSSTSASADNPTTTADTSKRRSTRNASKDRRAKKARRSVSVSSTSTADSAEDVFISPTLLTWVVSAGVVVVLSALSFSAGYAIGHEAGQMEAGLGVAAQGGSCAAEAGRAGMGLRRLRFATQV